MSNAKGLYKIKKRMRTESEKLSKSAGKQSLWSKVGAGLGGLLAIGLTGGAAAPAVAALMAGGGTLAGGIIGRQIGKSQKGGNFQGGRYYKDEALDLKKQINDTIYASAFKAALSAGSGKLLSKLGGKLSLGKDGIKASADLKGFNLGKLFEAGESTHTYSNSLMGKLGQAIDVKGSTLGKAYQFGADQLGNMRFNKLIKGEGFTSTSGDGLNVVGTGKVPSKSGSEIPDLEDFWDADLPEGVLDQDVYRAQINQIDTTPQSPRGSAQDLFPSIDLDIDNLENIPEAKAMKTTFSGKIKSNLLGGLSKDEKGLKNTLENMWDEGYHPEKVEGTNFFNLPEEHGKGYISSSGEIMRDPNLSSKLDYIRPENSQFNYLNSEKVFSSPEMIPTDTFQNKVRDYFGFNKSYELDPDQLKRYNEWNNLSDTYEGELNNTWQDRLFGGK